jgi:RNA polymerase sigma factor (TIGR02999 family)
VDSGEITALLAAAGSNEPGARDRLASLIYKELDVIARARLRGQDTVTSLDATALVHECWIRLSQAAPGAWPNRRAFYAYASSVMRSVIVDHARERRAGKRGAGERPLTLTTGMADEVAATQEVTALGEALDALGRTDARLLEIVEMRYFAGLSIEDVAEVLGVSPVTVKRRWQAARAFLYEQLRE